MKFIFFAREEFREAPKPAQASLLLTSTIALIVLIEILTSGLLLGIAPSLNIGSGILGVFGSYLIFDSANTMLRKRRIGYALTYFFALGSVIIGLLAGISFASYAGFALALLGGMNLILINMASTRNYVKG
jgi:hypothetical protein